MKRTTIFTSRALAFCALAAITGCATSQGEEAPLSHAEVAAAHRSASRDTMLFATGDIAGVTLVRDWESDVIASDAVMLRTQRGFITGDMLGTVALQTPSIRTLAAAAEDE